ncbi:MAG: hypothetical protein BalsKO_04830 [Balneolaceae bacterium]
MEKKDKSRMGLGFLVGMLGAYISVELFVRLGYKLSLNEWFSEAGFNYLISSLSGLITGALTVFISKERQLRILYFVVGSLIVMDVIAYLSGTNFTFTRFSYRLILDLSVLIGGFITYRVIEKSENPA